MANAIEIAANITGNAEKQLSVLQSRLRSLDAYSIGVAREQSNFARKLYEMDNKNIANKKTLGDKIGDVKQKIDVMAGAAGIAAITLNQMYNAAKKFAEETGNLKIQSQFSFAEESVKSLKNYLIEASGAASVLGDAMQSVGRLGYIAQIGAEEAKIVALNKELESINAGNFLHYSQMLGADRRRKEIADEILAAEKKISEIRGTAAGAETKSVLSILKDAGIGKAISGAFSGVANSIKESNDQLKQFRDLLLDADDAIRRGDARKLAGIQRSMSDAGIDPRKALSSPTTAAYMQSQGISVNVYLEGEVVQGAARAEIARNMGGMSTRPTIGNAVRY